MSNVQGSRAGRVVVELAALVLGLGLALGAGCSSATNLCAPHLETGCTCENGAPGKQVCNDSGTAFGACFQCGQSQGQPDGGPTADGTSHVDSRPGNGQDVASADHVAVADSAIGADAAADGAIGADAAADGGDGPDAAVCGLVPQSGCGPSLACDFPAAPKCRGAAPIGVGGCNVPEDCGAGWTCQFGACAPLCIPAAGACHAGSCVVAAPATVGYCTTTCDPTSEFSPCEQGTKCGFGEGSTTTCVNDGCNQGTGPSSSGGCAAWCTNDGDCPSFRHCLPSGYPMRVCA